MKYIQIMPIVAFFLVSRYLAVIQELPPYQFCDEGIYLGEAWRLDQGNQWLTNEFRAGGVNTYLVLILLKIANIFILDLNYVTFVLISRAVTIIFFGLITIYYIYKIILIVTASHNYALLGVIIYVISPFVLSTNRFYYPDHIIYFFSVGFLYYLMNCNLFYIKSTNFLGLGLFTGALLSTKYTTFVFIVPIVILMYKLIQKYYKSKHRAKVFINIALFTIITLLVIVIINFSIFFKRQEFFNGFVYNLNNYNSSQGTYIESFLYYNIVLFGLFFGVLSIFPLLFGGVELYKSDRFLFMILTLTPLSLILSLSTAGLVLNRNLSSVFIFFLPIYALGIKKILNSLPGKKNILHKYIQILIVLIFLFQSLLGFLGVIRNDLKVDSRIIAEKWIEDNYFIFNSSIGTNEFCSGLSPAHKLNADLAYDPNFDQKFQTYIINSYWSSPLEDFFKRREGILQISDQKYIHFYNFNDKYYWNFSKDKYSLIEFVPDDYKIIQHFNGNGPEIIILQKK